MYDNNTIYYHTYTYTLLIYEIVMGRCLAQSVIFICIITGMNPEARIILLDH